MTKLVVKSLTKSVSERVLFHNLSLTLERGDRLAVVGPNGCGKSTLLKILSGEERPDAGRVDLSPSSLGAGHCLQDVPPGELAEPLLDWVMQALPSWSDVWQGWQEAEQAADSRAMLRLADEQTRLESIYGSNPEARARAILQGLGFDRAMQAAPLERLSGGWRERAKLARALVAGSDLLLLDEPTNHLDLDALAWLESFVLGYPGIVVFVAHERCFLDRIGNQLLYLGELGDRTRPVLHRGNFTSFLHWLEETEKTVRRQAEKLDRQIEQKRRFVDRFRAKASKASLAQSRLKQIQALEARKQELERPALRQGISFRWQEPERSGDTVLSVIDLRFGHAPGRELWPPLSFSLLRGQKVGLLGPNGCGKSTLLKLLTGALEPVSGQVRLGFNVHPAYFAQHMSDMLREENAVLSEMRRLCRHERKEEEMRFALGMFLLDEGLWERKVAALSGGERSKLLLASIFLAGANLLILDEPTNNLDLESRQALVQALASFGGTVLMVAHDRHLLAEAASELWALGSNGLEQAGFGILESGTVRAIDGATDSEEDETAKAPGKREQRREQKRLEAERRNALSRALRPRQERYAELEAELERVLGELEASEDLLADPSTYRGKDAGSEASRRYRALQSRSELLLEELHRLEQEIQELQNQGRMA